MNNEFSLSGRLHRVDGKFDRDGRLMLWGWLEIPHHTDARKTTKVPFRSYDADETVLEWAGRAVEVRAGLGWSQDRATETWQMVVVVFEFRLVGGRQNERPRQHNGSTTRGEGAPRKLARPRGAVPPARRPEPPAPADDDDGAIIF